MKNLKDYTEGDLNAVMDRTMDKPTPGSSYSEIPKAFQRWMRDRGIKN